LTDAEKKVVEGFFTRIRQPGIAVKAEHSESASAEHQFKILSLTLLLLRWRMNGFG
jgi:hypothetical protein